ncbi:hypothetical protein D5086_004114 [Populus alba]|uniref:Uncharacterized protein n=1 Tax=Populus alba TaxID=43335 RepID=A0ACC4CPL6_POPAL
MTKKTKTETFLYLKRVEDEDDIETLLSFFLRGFAAMEGWIHWDRTSDGSLFLLIVGWIKFIVTHQGYNPNLSHRQEQIPPVAPVELVGFVHGSEKTSIFVLGNDPNLLPMVLWMMFLRLSVAH